MQQTEHKVAGRHASRTAAFQGGGRRGASTDWQRDRRWSRVEQTIYRLLGNFSSADFADLHSLSPSEIDRVIERLSADGLCSYALWNVADAATSLPDRLSSGLRRMSASEYISWQQSEWRVRPVLEIISRVSEGVALIKGRAVAAAVYPAPHLRHSADIDVVVAEPLLDSFFEQLQAIGFVIDGKNSSLFRAGPLREPKDVLLQPDAEFIACDALPLSAGEGCHLDLKLDPLESGLRMRELSRFFANCRETGIGDFQLKTPDLIDQLLIACCHFHKDNFKGLRLLLDIHLISRALDAQQWTELVRRARAEGVEASVWAALQLSADRLRTEVPGDVLEQLRPANNTLSLRALYSLSYRFLWNQTSLPMLIANALVSSNRDRKLRTLWHSFSPGKRFLQEYYGRGPMPLLLMVHWWAMLAPAGLIRRTLGLFLWKNSAAG